MAGADVEECDRAQAPLVPDAVRAGHTNPTVLLRVAHTPDWPVQQGSGGGAGANQQSVYGRYLNPIQLRQSWPCDHGLRSQQHLLPKNHGRVQWVVCETSG